MGTALGISVVRAMKRGTMTVRIVSPHGPIGLSDALGDAGFELTTFVGPAGRGRSA